MTDYYAVKSNDAIVSSGDKIAEEIGRQINDTIESALKKRLQERARFGSRRMESVVEDTLFYMKNRYKRYSG